ncbi:Transport-associated protein [Paraburkholderia ribeironis]|uniref:Transport-associated protein n=1 Tax=Paraburkholderia ribeironis TaxID=1247936 RepID=A0A1N7SB44_9BURK|nr:BON domain-containing protein [Paraburkholderia ribeironis]SIT44629.1 Transport-associated protein [Paraburkholderia ribeironis]
MKSSKAVRWISGIALAIAACGALAQGGSETSAPAGATTASSAKEMRAANRALQKKVRYALAHTKGLNASGISVRAMNGAVTLQGWVPEQSQSTLAEQVTSGVAGVTSVRNLLIVRPVGQ